LLPTISKGIDQKSSPATQAEEAQQRRTLADVAHEGSCGMYLIEAPTR
jgi:hypothetical protein